MIPNAGSAAISIITGGGVGSNTLQAAITTVDSISIGAMTLHQSVADSDLFQGGHELVRDAARRIGHPAIRNMGTMGGSIGHADSAADYPTALVAAEAQIEIAGPHGRRAVPAASFFVDYLQTSLGPAELVIGVRLPATDATSAPAPIDA